MNFENIKKPIVYFGRLTESKGFEITIKAVYKIYNEYPESIVPLWIIGGNYIEIQKFRELESLHKIIEYLEIRNLLFWWGQVPNNFLPYILCKCSMFCFTSKYEPGGRTILEAMASKLVVIATPHGFARETIQNGINGFIIENYESLDQWVNLIYTLLKNPELCNQIGEAANKTIQNKYTMRHFHKSHWDIYNSFIQEYNIPL